MVPLDHLGHNLNAQCCHLRLALLSKLTLATAAIRLESSLLVGRRASATHIVVSDCWVATLGYRKCGESGPLTRACHHEARYRNCEILSGIQRECGRR